MKAPPRPDRRKRARPGRVLLRHHLLSLLGVVLLAVGSLSTAPLNAQQIQPTAEQLRMLNQLPPEQRRQAMEALRQYQAQQRGRQAAADDEQGELEEEDLDRPLRAPSPVEPDIPVAEGGTSLVVTLTPRLDLEESELDAIEADPALSRIRGSHYYELDESGVLLLPGLVDIPLLGLTAGAIEQRLGAERALAPFDVRVSILGVESTGVRALKPFGYELFESLETQFATPTSGPVPPDYVIGEGDSLRVQLFGSVNNIYDLEVSRDGTVNIPELGPVDVAGLRFADARAEIENRVQQMLIGTQASVTMGVLRSIRVFVVGDVVRPGSYVVSSLATMSSALYRSGGISEVGSLRDIQLKRQGETVARLDLYDLLLRGDTSNDRQLRQGDAIFVPPVGDTVGVGGAVRRPAIYETRGEMTVAEVIALAGGLSAEAFPDAATLERINDDRERSVVNVAADSAAGGGMRLRNGDILMIPRVLSELERSVELDGHVHRPGPREWHPGMRLGDLIPSLSALKPGADSNYVLVRRESEGTRRITTESADLALALSAPESMHNLPLQPRDRVYVFSLTYGRQRIIGPILEELQLQANHAQPYREVRVAGRVRAPGSYPLDADMRVSDLLRAGAKLDEGAYTETAELTRFSVINGELRVKEVVDVNLREALRGNPEADLLLSPYDHLYISTVPNWNSDWSVTVEGEVLFPGEYQIRKGETMSQLLDRAGGLTDEAFAEGAIFLRESLKEREREQLETLAQRLESDLASASLQSLDTTGAEALSIGQTLLTQIRTTEPVGRLVIDLERIVADSRVGGPFDVELRDGDRLLVPGRSQEVTVLGEAQYPTSHLFRPGLGRDDYIGLSGGLTRKADRKLIYVVRASGAVVSGDRSRWFSRGGGTEIRPGDTIVIPVETDRIRPLTFWTNVSQIFYQTAIAVAAIRTFDN